MGYQREFERRVRIGVVGVGDHAYRNILPLLNFLPVEFAALADTNSDLGERTALQYGRIPHYESAAKMYENEELDAVLLCVSPKLHPQLATEALASGLHVWMEKAGVDVGARGRRDDPRARRPRRGGRLQEGFHAGHR